jgi:hypothetical protein
MDDLAAARALHVLGVVIWIGGAGEDRWRQGQADRNCFYVHLCSTRLDDESACGRVVEPAGEDLVDQI